jgi:hypothetical protein
MKVVVTQLRKEHHEAAAGKPLMQHHGYSCVAPIEIVPDEGYEIIGVMITFDGYVPKLDA